jgi:cytosine/adenosine deaminase-related metal-dependent hydrolase
MRFLKAHKLFSGKVYLPEGSVLVLDDQNLLKDIVHEAAVEKNEIENFEGVISPGFVNAHCHLELSHLKNKIPQHTGLPGFAKQVVMQRNNTGKEEIRAHMERADSEMWEKGIVAVGDISNGEDSFHKKSSSKIYYHTFIELIGLNPLQSNSLFEKGSELLQKLNKMNLPGSLAPHAPYSTSRELIQRIAAEDYKKGLPFSIHNQESEEETKFFEGKQNAFEDLYRFLNLEISWFEAPGISSLKYYGGALSHGRSLLVHNTFTRAEDLELVKDKTISWCFCPGANKYIENRLPDLTLFSRQKDRLCIGTDSLASNTQLDVIEEANLILNNSRELSYENMLRALTFNGAEALGISGKYGQFIIGKNTGLNLLEFEADKINFIKKII